MSRFPDLHLDEQGILREHHFDGYITKDCAMYVAEERARLVEGRKHPVLVEFDGLTGFDPKTREMDLDFVLKAVSALAYYVDTNSPEGRETQRILDSFFNITPWPVPVAIFHERGEALAWLKQYLPD